MKATPQNIRRKADEIGTIIVLIQERGVFGISPPMALVCCESTPGMERGDIIQATSFDEIDPDNVTINTRHRGSAYPLSHFEIV